MKKTIWRPLVLGVAAGLLAGIATVAGLSFLVPGITENSIGFYVTLFLLAAALGGPLAGAIAPLFWVALSAWYGPPGVRAILETPVVFWANAIALGVWVGLVGLAYRLIYERVKMPARLLPWSVIVIAQYVVALPSSVVSQYVLLGYPRSEILPAVLEGYRVYAPQAIFDILITSLVFVALPASYTRPLWYARKKAPGQTGETPES